MGPRLSHNGVAMNPSGTTPFRSAPLSPPPRPPRDASARAEITHGATTDRRSAGADDGNRPRSREERALNLEAKPRHWHPGRFDLLP